MSELITDIERHGVWLADRILAEIDPTAARFDRHRSLGDDVAAHQLLWARFMTTGTSRFGEAVVKSLHTFCRAAHVDRTRDCAAEDVGGGPSTGKSLADDAQLLELLTWVWRVEHCAELQHYAGKIVARAATDARVQGLGFAARPDDLGRDRVGRLAANGFMLVALVEAGSVFEQRDWLVLAREVFDELAALLAEHDAARGTVEDAAMARAAIRLFEAFGKQRYLDLAEAWIADRGRMDGFGARALCPGSALMIGILARLHALTGAPHYAARADALIEILHPAIVRSGIESAPAVANALTAVRLLSIRVTGDPRLAETREIMRVALDCGLPDRLVLGPGAGGAAGERPLAQIRVGAHRLAPVDDAAQLRTLLAPGGLSAAFDAATSRETVDSRTEQGLT